MRECSGQSKWTCEPVNGVVRLTYLAACAVLLILVVFVNPPTHTTFMYVLHKSAHSAAFALIALIYLKLAAKPNEADWWKPYVGALGAVLVCGVGTEIAQFYLHRNPSFEDVLRDATGGTASLAIVSLRQPFMHGRLRACLALLATAASSAAVMPLVWCVAAYAHRDYLFPIILEYQSPLDMYFVKVWNGPASGVDLPNEWAVRPNEKAIEVGLDAKAPGIRLFETYPDWRGYSALALDVTNRTRPHWLSSLE